MNNNNLLAPNGKVSNLNPTQYKIVRTPEFKAWFGDWENDPKNASKVLDENGEPLVVYHGTNEDFNAFSENAKRKGVSNFGYFFTSSPLVAESYTIEESLINNPSRIESGQAYGKNANIIPVFLNIRKPISINANKQKHYRIGQKTKIETKERLISTKDLYTQFSDYSNQWMIRDKKSGSVLFFFKDDKKAQQALEELKKEPTYLYKYKIDVVKKLGVHINELISKLQESKINDGLIIKNIVDVGSDSFRDNEIGSIASTIVVKRPTQIKSAYANTNFDANNPDITLQLGGYIFSTEEKNQWTSWLFW